jgi:translation initiation factor IF-2
MAKMRIHELAKEIDKTSKEVITLLETQGISGKAAQSTLEDTQVEIVKKALSGADTSIAKQTHKEETAKPSLPGEQPAEKMSGEEHNEEAPKKKKPNIIFVSNPHNSRASGGQNQMSRPQGNNEQRAQGSNQGRPGNSPGIQNRQASGVMQGRPTPAVKITNVERTSSINSTANETNVVNRQNNEEINEKIEPKQSDLSEQTMEGNQSGQTNTQVQENNQKSRTDIQGNNSSSGNPNSDNRSYGRNDTRQGQSGGVRQSQGGYSQASRPSGQGSQGGYSQGSRPSGQGSQGGYSQGSRPSGQGSQGGYSQGSRPSGQGSQGGYSQGSRPSGQGGQGGYSQGSRPGGYNQGSRPGGQGGYSQGGQGSQGGYSQGNRPSGQGGYSQGSRPGGYNQGGRPGAPNQANRTGGTAAAGFDSGTKMTAKEQEKHRDEQEKRRLNQDKKRKDQVITNEDGFRGGKLVKGAKPAKLEKPQEKFVIKEEKIKVIILPEVLTIKELAEKMKMVPAMIVKKLFLQGTVVTVNQEITYAVAEEIAMEFEILCEKEVVVDVIEELLKEETEDTSMMTQRPPVVCVMGHVDHGKTSLLDAIRKTNVTGKEAGGITQHIGAYVVTINGQKITFLDTPGHEAFTSMRMRGANATDIAILVVAADDGVMPQTIEAINHAKAAGIEVIVAINKIDKPSANIDKVKQELAEYELIPEDWGGSTVFAQVSAKSGEGIEQMLEMILLTADIAELKANEKRKARGLVIEAELDKGRGPIATVLVQKGTLKVGDFIAAGACHGKVRAMIDDKGRRVKEAGPSMPVEILGLGDVPNAGDIFVAPENDKEARNFAETFISQKKVRMLDDTKAKMLSLDDLFTQIQAGNLKELNIIIKADVQGSVEAVKESLLKLTNEEVVVKVIHGGVGSINESDVILASASNAIIIGFNVRPDVTAKAISEAEGVDVRLYNVIYKAIEDVEAAMKGMLDPVFEERVLGHAEVRQIFKASGIGNIAGSYVLDGIFKRGCSVRIKRGEEKIYEGPLASLKRFKDDVKEVKTGFECGLVFDDFNDIQELDIVEAYTMVEVPR